jgi:hypothetical protein
MRYVLILAMLPLLSGCGWVNRADGYLTGYSFVCVKGVTYVQFPTGAAPLYSIDGKLIPCSD